MQFLVCQLFITQPCFRIINPEEMSNEVSRYNLADWF